MADEAELIRQYRKLVSELEHHEEELPQPENQHVVCYMKEYTSCCEDWEDTEAGCQLFHLLS